MLVPKPDGSSQLCTDFRKLNAVAIPVLFTMPRFDDLLDKFGGAKFVTKFDMTKGYWQVRVRPEDVPLTGFVSPHRLWQWIFLPLGLSGAPATFCKLVKKLLEGLEDMRAAYLDDIIVFSTEWELHLQHLSVVLDRNDNAHLTSNLNKCVFANSGLDFLGHHVKLQAIQPRINKVERFLSFHDPRIGKRCNLY